MNKKRIVWKVNNRIRRNIIYVFDEFFINLYSKVGLGIWVKLSNSISEKITVTISKNVFKVFGKIYLEFVYEK